MDSFPSEGSKLIVTETFIYDWQKTKTARLTSNIIIVLFFNINVCRTGSCVHRMKDGERKDRKRQRVKRSL